MESGDFFSNSVKGLSEAMNCYDLLALKLCLCKFKL